MLIVSKVLMVLCEHLRGVEHLRRMSERSPEADIRPRCFSVAQVPCVDGSRLASQNFTSPSLVGAAMCSASDARALKGRAKDIRSRSIALSERLVGRNSHAQHRSTASRPGNEAR
jgi:hypothetical protein